MRGAFDLCASQYLLCYAPSRDLLQSMAQNAYDSLSSGGEFISLTDNPANTPAEDYDKWEHASTHTTT